MKYSDIKAFLGRDDVQECLSQDDMGGVYDIWLHNVGYETNEIPKLTDFFIENNINFLDYLRVIPICCYYETVIKSIEIPSNIEIIDSSAFDGSELEHVKFNEGLKEIRDGSFYLCEGLTHLELPNSLTYIGDAAFSHCINLKSISIPNNLKLLGLGVFDNCINLNEIYFNDEVYTYEEFRNIMSRWR